jgi:hypothetical protein
MERGRLTGFWTLIWTVGMLSGCGQQPSMAPATGAAAPSAGQAGIDSPAHTVQMFLAAIRKCDDAEAGRWLTKLALQKTTELKMSIAPPGSQTAQFEVGEVEMVEGGAHVASTWSDLDADGNRQKEPIVWVVAKEPEGWRICGLATTLFEEKLPIVLNFADPEEMARKQQYAEAEAARSSAQGATTPSAEQEAKPVQAKDARAMEAPQDRLIEAQTPSSPDFSAAPSTAARNVLREGKPR